MYDITKSNLFPFGFLFRYYKEVTEEDLSKPSLVAGQGKFVSILLHF